jgi:hypothetical protein
MWQTVVGPIFQGAWPIDADLQTSHATFKLVQLLLATGQAFGEAAPVIISKLLTIWSCSRGMDSCEPNSHGVVRRCCANQCI